MPPSLTVFLSHTLAPVPFYMSSPIGKKGADVDPATIGDWEPPLDADPYASLSCAVKENNCGQHAGHSHGSQDRQLVLALLVKVRQLETQRLEDQAECTRMVATETDARETEDGKLEKAMGQYASKMNSQNMEEAQARAEADVGINAKLGKETEDRKASISEVATAAAAEQEARREADTNIQQNADKSINAALRHSNENDKLINAKLGKETEERKTEDGVLEKAMRQYVSKMNSQDAEEAQARAEADVGINAKLGKETEDRKASISEVATAAESEAHAREEADVAINAALDHLTEANKTINAALDQEVVDRKRGDNAYINKKAASNAGYSCDTAWAGSALPYGSLDDAKKRCNNDAECKYLHDVKNDNENWRTCSSVVFAADGKGAALTKQTINAALDQEVVDRKSDTESINAALDNEKKARATAITNAVEKEKKDRMVAETVLTEDVEQEASDRKTEDGKLEDADNATNTALVTETEARKAADGVHDATLLSRAGWALRVNEKLALKADKENVTARLTDIIKAVEKEKKDRAAGDGVLATADGSEAEARNEADKAISAALESGLAALEKETDARQTEDGVLATAATAEAKTRADADVLINAALDKETEDRQAADGVLATAAAELRAFAELLGAAYASEHVYSKEVFHAYINTKAASNEGYVCDTAWAGSALPYGMLLPAFSLAVLLCVPCNLVALLFFRLPVCISLPWFW